MRPLEAVRAKLSLISVVNYDISGGGERAKRKPARAVMGSIALVGGMAVTGVVTASPAWATTDITNCLFSTLKADVALGGTIDYEVPCTGSGVVFAEHGRPAELKIGKSQVVDIEANGFSVAFNGKSTHAAL